VDATYRRRSDRDALRATGIPAVFVECRAPAGTLAERARRRERDPARVSDATAEIAERQLAEFEPRDEVPPSEHLIVRSDREVAAVAADVEALLDARSQPRSGGVAKCP
jgi:predicted kinase